MKRFIRNRVRRNYWLCLILFIALNNINYGQSFDCIDRTDLSPCDSLMIAPIGPFCDSAQAILLSSLGAGINLNSSRVSFLYTDTQNILRRIATNKGLIRTFYARVPDLDRNGTQKTYRDSEVLRWRYFKKRYFYNVSIRSRFSKSIENQYGNSCWIEMENGGKSFYDKQQLWNVRGQVGYLEWVSAADRPPINKPMERFELPDSTTVLISPERIGCLSILFRSVITTPFSARIEAVTSTGVRRILANFPFITGNFTFNFIINSGEFLDVVITGIPPLTTYSYQTSFDMGRDSSNPNSARSNDNICLYDRELPLIGVDYN